MKKIIAAALSILVGAFGYTIVDSAIEDRVATLESEVVELREEVSRYHPSYADTYTTTKNETTITPNKTTTTKKSTTRPQDLSQPVQVGAYLREDSRSIHKFALRKWDNGEVVYIPSDNYNNISFTNGMVGRDYFLYVTSSSVQITDVSEDISYSQWYDRDYSMVTTKINRPTTIARVFCKGYTDPVFAGMEVSFRGYIEGHRYYSLNGVINTDGTFEIYDNLYLESYVLNYRYFYIDSVSVESIVVPTTAKFTLPDVVVTRQPGVTIFDEGTTIPPVTNTKPAL